MATKHPYSLEQILSAHNVGNPSPEAGTIRTIDAKQVMLVKHYCTVAGRQSWYVHVAGDPPERLRTATIREY